jgi:hypothetical protein
MPSQITLNDIDKRLIDIEASLDLTQVELSIDKLSDKLEGLHRELRGIRLILFIAFFFGLPLLLAPLIHSLPTHL